MSLDRLSVGPYDAAQADEVDHLFFDYGYKDYQLKFLGVAKERMVQYLKGTLDRADVQSLCLRNGRQLVGFMALERLPWMSDHFGVRMYAVSHLLATSGDPIIRERLVRYAIEELQDVDFLDCRVAVEDVASIQALESCGFRYVGTEVYLGTKLDDSRAPTPPPGFEIGPCQLREQKEVVKLAVETHHHNRFSYDPLLGESASKSLYGRIVANRFADGDSSVLVARSGGSVQGFIVSKLNNAFSKVVGKQCGSLDLIGVRPRGRERGLGTALNLWALHDMAGKGAVYAAVRTLAGNYPALAACYRTGFRVTSTSVHFHRWIRRPARAATATGR